MDYRDTTAALIEPIEVLIPLVASRELLRSLPRLLAGLQPDGASKL